jgi:hypothetical protein
MFFKQWTALKENSPMLFRKIAVQHISIISWTGAATWSKTNFEPTGHHLSLSTPLPLACTVPSASGIF